MASKRLAGIVVFYLMAARGIRRERAWSAYGLALLTLVLTAVPFAVGVLREQGLGNRKASNLGVAVAFSLALVSCFLGPGGRWIHKQVVRC
jgi:hypothetical protein